MSETWRLCFFLWRCCTNRPYAASLLTFLDHAQLDTHTRGRTPLNGWSARREHYLHTSITQETQDTNIYGLRGISNLRSQQSGGCKYTLDRSATRIDRPLHMNVVNWHYRLSVSHNNSTDPWWLSALLPIQFTVPRRACTRWFKYDRDWCRQIYTQISPGRIWTTLYYLSRFQTLAHIAA